jgi:divalent metal cation (Fe/Co/Zn/Cd) transporter
MQSRREDRRTTGYILVFAGVLWAAMAIDRLFFHKTLDLGWLAAALALGFFSHGAWLLFNRAE